MTRLILLFCIYFVSVGFSCQPKNVGKCAYMECLKTVPSYPKPVLVLVPKKVKMVRVHFHGFILGLLEQYESSLSGMVEAFELNSRICKGHEVVIIPQSEGKCETYQQSFQTAQDLTTLLAELNYADLPLHLSAHSGGGKTLVRLLNTGLGVQKVSVFDGVYSETEKQGLSDWYKQDKGILLLSSVKGMSPDKFIDELRNDLSLEFRDSKVKLRGTSYDSHLGPRIRHYSRSAGQAGNIKAHYKTVTETWNAPN